MYGVPIAVQTKIMFLALGLGFLVGILYDVFRIIRLSISKGKKAVFVQDIIFFFLFAWISFAFCLSQNKGQVRFYIIFAEVLGFLIYYFSFGSFVIKLSDKIIVAVKKAYGLLLKIISYPILLIFKIFRAIFKPIYRKILKRTKNFTKKAKFYLQVNKFMLYNTIRRSLSFKKHNKRKECKLWQKYRAKNT